MAPELILMCGLPGSGKTTLARKLAIQRRAVRLCTDDWQAALHVDHDNEAFHDLLEDQLWALAKTLLELGQSVIFEKGLWVKSERDEKRREAKELAVDIELHVFDVPVEELARRLVARRVEGRPDVVHVNERELRDFHDRIFQPPDDAELALFPRAVRHRHPERPEIE